MGGVVSGCWSSLPDEDAVREIPQRVLFDAVHAGDLDSVRKFLRLGLNVHIEDKNCKTPLHVAAQHGYTDIVEHLILGGANLSAVDMNFSTPLLAAAIGGHEATVRLLVQHKADVNEITRGGYTPLHLVLRHAPHPYQVAITLLESGANPHAVTDERETPLHCACYNPDAPQVVDLMIKRGNDVNARAAADITPLHVAVSYSSHTCVTRLIRAGADPSAKTSNGATALHLAAQSLRLGRSKILHELLLHCSCSIPDWINEPDDEGSTPLHYAASKGQQTILELLLKQDVNICAKDKDGRTALHTACLSKFTGRRMICETLIERGLKVEETDSYGNTALHCAARSGNTAAVEALLPHCDPAAMTTCNNSRKTPIHAAAANGGVEVVKIMLSAFAETLKKDGVDILAATDIDGQTPLHLACKEDNGEVVTALIDAGASCTTLDNSGSSPLEAAASSSNGGTVALQALMSAENAKQISDQIAVQNPGRALLGENMGHLRQGSVVQNGSIDVEDPEGESVLTIPDQQVALAGYSKQGSDLSAMSQQSSAPSVELIPGRMPSASKQYKPRLPAVDHEASTKRLTFDADIAAVDGDKAPPSATRLSTENSANSQTGVETTLSQHRRDMEDEMVAAPARKSESRKVVLEELGMSSASMEELTQEEASHEEPIASAAKDAECSPEEMRDGEKSQGSSAHGSEGDEAHQNVTTDAVKMNDTAYEPAGSKQPLSPDDTVVDKGEAGSVPSHSDGSADTFPGMDNNMASGGGEANSSGSVQNFDTGSSGDQHHQDTAPITGNDEGSC